MSRIDFKVVLNEVTLLFTIMKNVFPFSEAKSLVLVIFLLWFQKVSFIE